jgi:hypothetical protein
LNGRKLWWFQGASSAAQDAAARRSDVGRRLMTIPGVGPVTSLAYIATVDDPSRFCTSKTLGAHLGLTPRVYQSDEIYRQIGANQQMRRSNAATSPLRSRIRADNPFPEAVSSAGLGYLRRQTSGHEARHRRRGSQARRDHASHLGHRR